MAGRRMRTLRAAALTLALTACPLVAFAQDAPDGEDAASSRSATFQAVEGPSTEDVPGAPFLVAAYGTILVLLVGYVTWLSRLQSGTAREIDRLRRVIDRAEAKKSG